MKLPLSRNRDIVVQETGKELLVYDLITHKAYNLNETSKIVFNACDGNMLFDELKAKHKFTDELIYFALDELKINNLITSEYQSIFAGISRRDVIKKIGLISMVALPLILPLSAPAAAAALSCLGAKSGDPGGTGICAPTSGTSCTTIALTSCLSCAATSGVLAICVTPGNPAGVVCTCT